MILFSGLLLSLFLEYVNPGNFVPVISAIKIGTIIPLLTFVLAVLQVKPVSNGQVLKQPVTKWILFFLSLLVLSVLIADVTLYSWTIFKFVLGYVFWYIMLVKLVTDLDRLKSVILILVLSHVLLLALNPDVVLHPETRSYLRAAPFLGDGNDFSLSVCVLFPLCIWLLLRSESKTKKAMYVVALCVLLLAIIGTQSRGATLALVGLFGFLWWRGRRKVLGIALISIVAVGAVAFAPPEYFQRMETITNFQQEGSAMGRIMAWKSGIRMAKKYPATGVGSGHFAVALGTEFRPPEFGDENLPWLTAHSMYFLVIGELGLPGIICFLAILIGNYRRLRRLWERARQGSDSNSREFEQLFLMLGGSLVAFCIGGAFLSVAYYPHIFVLSGLIVAAALIFERTEMDAAATGSSVENKS